MVSQSGSPSSFFAPPLWVLLREGTRRSPYVVAGPVSLELAASIAALAPSLRPSFVSGCEAAASALLVLLLWTSTGLLQVPLHEHLGQTRDPPRMVRLLRSNWIRSAAWTAHSVLLLVCLHRAL